jgi:hypothetical protein
MFAEKSSKKQLCQQELHDQEKPQLAGMMGTNSTINNAAVDTTANCSLSNSHNSSSANQTSAPSLSIPSQIQTETETPISSSTCTTTSRSIIHTKNRYTQDKDFEKYDQAVRILIEQERINEKLLPSYNGSYGGMASAKEFVMRNKTLQSLGRKMTTGTTMRAIRSGARTVGSYRTNHENLERIEPVPRFGMPRTTAVEMDRTCGQDTTFGPVTSGTKILDECDEVGVSVDSTSKVYPEEAQIESSIATSPPPTKSPTETTTTSVISHHPKFEPDHDKDDDRKNMENDKEGKQTTEEEAGNAPDEVQASAESLRLHCYFIIPTISMVSYCVLVSANYVKNRVG